MKIGILTTFSNLDPSYSLASVVRSQLVSFKKYGYDVVFLTLPSFRDDDKVPEGIEIRKIVPQFKLVDYADNRPTEQGFEDQVETAYKARTNPEKSYHAQ